MELYIGTCGYSYREWKGSFYPEDLPPRSMLRFYGQRLPAVEINNTFYSMPRPDVLQAWAEQVPPGFRFVLKASGKITHNQPLKGKEPDVGYFCRTARILGPRLGAILLQLPPSLPADPGLLADFLELLPTDIRAAFEFRHPSWFDDRIYELLHRRGSALCWAETEEGKPDRWIETADWGYLRLRRPGYSDAELAAWAREIKARKWRLVFAFFKHENSGAGPEMAQRLLDLIRMPG